MRPRRSPLKKLLYALFIAALGVVVAAGLAWQLLLAPVTGKEDFQEFEVVSGTSVGAIAVKLERQGLIRSPLAFKATAYLLGIATKLQAGNYHLAPSQSTVEIARILTNGRLDDIRLTVPEGFRTEQVAQLVGREMGLDPVQVLHYAKEFEGRLFPDTYFIPKDRDERAVVELMLENYRRKTAPLTQDLQAAELSENQVLTLASIVERETLTDEEKPVVAGILLKRLEAGWALQTDATLQYIVASSNCRSVAKDCPNWWPVPTVTDRKLVSPFNTYAHPGLPPAPIANPGLESIKAVLHPEPSEYWFYIHDASGLIRYAATDEEHAANVNRYLR